MNAIQQYSPEGTIKPRKSNLCSKPIRQEGGTPDTVLGL